MSELILAGVMAAGWPLMAGLSLVGWSWARAAAQRPAADRTAIRVLAYSAGSNRAGSTA